MDATETGLIFGRAVDGETTDYRHQIFNITYDENEKPRILHYTVHRPVVKNTYEDLLLENLCDILSDERALKTDAGLNKAHSMFSRFMGKIKEGNTAQFVLGEEIPALTYDIFVDDDLEMYGMDFRPTLAMMTEELSCIHARELIKEKPADRDLKTWHDIAVRFKYHEPIKRILAFEDIINTTSTIVQDNLLPYSIDKRIACIFKNKPPVGSDRKYPKKYPRIYGSTIGFDENVKALGADPSNMMVSATASRDPIQCINIVAANAFKETGENIFEPELIASIAKYKMALAA